MHRLLKTTIALAITVSGSSRGGTPGGVRLLAKDIPHITVVVEDIKPALTRNGASVEAVRNQVELAIRRCGFTIVPSLEAKAMVVVNVSGHSLEGGGYSGFVGVQVLRESWVGMEYVLIEAWGDGKTISGPSGGAAMHVRSVVAELLDRFCNFYLQVRDQVRGETGK